MVQLFPFPLFFSYTHVVVREFNIVTVIETYPVSARYTSNMCATDDALFTKQL